MFWKKTPNEASVQPIVHREIGIVTDVWFGMDRGSVALSMDVKFAESEVTIRMEPSEAIEAIAKHEWTDIHNIEGEPVIVEMNQFGACRFVSPFLR